MKATLSLSIILILLSCSSSQEIEHDPYSFFVAGHTYGSVGSTTKGLYPPFMTKIDSCKNQLFGVLTGDIVRTGSNDEWKEVFNDINSMQKKVHIALGNHDYKNLTTIKERFENTYYKFFLNNDLHIILDPNIDKWNINGNQLDFLRTTLADLIKPIDNIFVYFHQVLWWSPNNEYANIRLNSYENRDSIINFWSDVVPLFQKLNKQVFMFAGDVGAAHWSDDYSYNVHKNIHFISSGMGEGKGDNYLIVNVQRDKKVKIELIPIFEGDPVILN